MYIEQMAEAPIAIVPLGGRLLTIWESGSALWVTAVQSTAHRVGKVLDVRPKGLPEIVFSKSGAERLIFTQYGEKTPSGTTAVPMISDIYLWTGERYDQRVGVPWEHRFDYVD